MNQSIVSLLYALGLALLRAKKARFTTSIIIRKLATMANKNPKWAVGGCINWNR